MKLKDYLRRLTPEQRDDYASRAETTVSYLYQVAGGHRQASARLSKRLEQESGQKVTRADLRPDLFGDLEPARHDAA